MNDISLPFGDVPSPVALFALVVEDLAEFATVPSGCVAVDAHVEELAVLRVGVTGVGGGHALVDLRALELEHLWRKKKTKLTCILMCRKRMSGFGFRVKSSKVSCRERGQN